MFIDGYFLLFQVRRASKTVDVGVWLSYCMPEVKMWRKQEKGVVQASSSIIKCWNITMSMFYDF